MPKRRIMRDQAAKALIEKAGRENATRCASAGIRAGVTCAM
jgi:hypothetical protein